VIKNTYDVVIIGGAAIGSATAFFLNRHAGFRGSVLVIEKDPGYTKCSTTLSMSSIRQQFSTPANILASAFGVEFIKQAKSEFGGLGDVSFCENGYLIMASHAAAGALRANHEIQRSLGANNVLLTPDEISERFPWMSDEAVALGCLGLSGEGWFDPHSLLNLYITEAKASGVDYIADEAVDLKISGGRVTAVHLASGEKIACGQAVNAAGPAAAKIAAMAELALPVEPRKRLIYVFDCREKDSITNSPLFFDPNGVFCRPEGAYFLTGVSPPEDQDPVCTDFEITYDLFEEMIWPTLANRVPAFKAIKLVNAWAGHYAYNTIDQNALLGSLPDVPNLYFANGFSGHGIQQSPAVGRGIAELITDGIFTSLDLSGLSVERLLSGDRVREVNVF